MGIAVFGCVGGGAVILQASQFSVTILAAVRVCAVAHHTDATATRVPRPGGALLPAIVVAGIQCLHQ